MYCLFECEALLGQWKSSNPFGKNGEIILYLLSLTPDLCIYLFRAAIEEEYAKRLAKLAKMTLGRDEIGYVLHIRILGAWWQASRLHKLD